MPTTAVLAGLLLAGLLLALGGVLALIYFIRHTAELLQTGTLLQRIMFETELEIRQLFPCNFGRELSAETFVAATAGWLPVPSGTAGYLQYIDRQGPLAWATRYRVVPHVNLHIGDFAGAGAALFSVRADMGRPALTQADWPADLLSYVSIGRHRNPAQGVAFGLQQLVDTALKALSAAISDTTAIRAIDYLGEITSRLAHREFPEALWVPARVCSLEGYVRLAFDLVRQNARGSPVVLRRPLRALALVASQVSTPDRLPVLRQQAQLVLTAAPDSLPTDYQRQEVQALYDELRGAWESPSAGAPHPLAPSPVERGD